MGDLGGDDKAELHSGRERPGNDRRADSSVGYAQPRTRQGKRWFLLHLYLTCILLKSIKSLNEDKRNSNFLDFEQFQALNTMILALIVFIQNVQNVQNVFKSFKSFEVRISNHSSHSFESFDVHVRLRFSERLSQFSRNCPETEEASRPEDANFGSAGEDQLISKLLIEFSEHTIRGWPSYSLHSLYLLSLHSIDSSIELLGRCSEYAIDHLTDRGKGLPSLGNVLRRVLLLVAH